MLCTGSAFRLPRLLCVAAAVLATGCDSPSAPDARAPAEVRLVRTASEPGRTGETLGDSVEVRVLNRGGEPVTGVEVEFAPVWPGTSRRRGLDPRGPARADTGEVPFDAEPCCGVLSPRRSTTDARGLARAAWTLGPVAGVQRAMVTLPGRRVPPLFVSARAIEPPPPPPPPALPASVVKVSGDSQTARVTETLAAPLVVQVRDSRGNAVPGAMVTWRATGGELAPLSERTDSSGLASATWTLGIWNAGLYHAVAAIADDSVVFTAYAYQGTVVRVDVRVPNRLVHPATVQAEAFSYDAYGNGGSLFGTRWKSSDTTVAVIEYIGYQGIVNVSTRGPGTAVISATVQGVTGSATILVSGISGGFRVTPVALRYASALNDAGDVAGWTDGTHVATWRNGVVTDLGIGDAISQAEARTFGNDGSILVHQRAPNTSVPADPWSGHSFVARDGAQTPVPGRAFDMGPDGAVAGGAWSLTPGAPLSGYLWRNGEVTRIVVPGGAAAESYAIAVNARHQVVVNLGRATSPDRGLYRAYLWDAGSLTEIPQPAARCAGWMGQDINNQGTVVVNCGWGVGAFLWDGHTFTSLHPITRAMSINNRGEVVGWGREPGRELDAAYVWRGGQAIRLMDRDDGVVNFVYLRINDHGQIVVATEFNSYLLTPVP